MSLTEERGGEEGYCIRWVFLMRIWDMNIHGLEKGFGFPVMHFAQRCWSVYTAFTAF